MIQPTPYDLIKEVGLVCNGTILLAPWETPRVAKDLCIQAETLSRLNNINLPTYR
jgi:hypothetical protein